MLLCRKLTGLLLLVSMNLPCNAQGSKADSLARVIAHYPANDTTKMNLLILLAKTLAYSDPSRAMKIIDTELPAAQQLRYKKGTLEGLNVKSSLYFLQGNRAQAQASAEEYLQMAERYSDKPGQIAANSLLGILYAQSANYAKALEYFLTSLRLAEEVGDKSRLAALDQNIGNVYNDIQDYDKAIGYYKESIAITQSIVPAVAVPPAPYNNIGSALIHQKKYKEALDYLDTGSRISLRTNNRRSLAGAYTNLADAWHNLGDNDKSYDYAIRALEIGRALSDKRTMANAMINVGTALSEASDSLLLSRHLDPKHRYPTAVAILDSAVQLAGSLGDPVTREEAYKYLGEISQRVKDYPLAISSMQAYEQLHDTIVNDDNEKTIIRKFIQYDFDKKAAIDALELAGQRRLKYALIAGLLLIGAIGVLLWRQGVIRKKANRELTRINAELDEANRVKARLFGIISHDLRAPVANLISLINLRKEAPDLLDEEGMTAGRQKITDTAGNLLHVMEDILLWSKGQMTAFRPRKKKLRIGEVFAELGLLYPPNARLRILFCDPQQLMLETDEDYLKTILRNLTSNAIKATHYRADGLIEWKAWQEDHHVCLSVSDNGPGMSANQRQALFNDDGDIGTRHGLGLPLIRDLTAAVDCEIRVDSPAGGGTTFTLLFPVVQQEPVSLS